MNKDLVFTDPKHAAENWFYKKYYEPYGGSNLRYYTFQIALNLLNQYYTNPLIIETGCQRQEEDVGAGMSTVIFAEYVQRYGGKVISVDNSQEHLNRAMSYVAKYPKNNCEFICSDSVEFLSRLNISPSLLYLDSYDHPILPNPNYFEESKKSQEHCLNEFKACEQVLDNCILLIDDNSFPEGGKPGLLKNYLIEKGWCSLLDLQQTLWIRGE